MAFQFHRSTLVSNNTNTRQSKSNNSTVDIVRRFVISNSKTIIVFLIGFFVGGRRGKGGITQCDCSNSNNNICNTANDGGSESTKRIRKVTAAAASSKSSSSNIATGASDAAGRIWRLQDIPIRNTSHVDDYGRPIVKQQFLDPFVVPTITGFSIATLQGGQRVKTHDHYNMHEFFYILEGDVIFHMKVNDNNNNENNAKKGDRTVQDVHVTAGTFLHFPPHAIHGLYVPENSAGSMKMLVAGVVPGDGGGKEDGNNGAAKTKTSR